MNNQPNFADHLTRDLRAIDNEAHERNSARYLRSGGKFYKTSEIADHCGTNNRTLLKILREEKLIITCKDRSRTAGHTLTEKGRKLGLKTKWVNVPNLPGTQSCIVQIPEIAREQIIEIATNWLEQKESAE